jgi:hypothetical protein
MAIFSPSQVETPKSINTGIGKIDYAIKITQWAKFGQDRSSGSVSHMGEVVG